MRLQKIIEQAQNDPSTKLYLGCRSLTSLPDSIGKLIKTT
jgi:hypothetical protein